MEIINAPGLVSRSPRLVGFDVDRWTSMPEVSAVFYTEMADDARATALHARGWTTSRSTDHAAHHRGKRECAIMTRDSMRRVTAVEWVRITDGGGTGRLSEPSYAIVVVTEAPSGRVTLLTGAHLEAHIEGIWAKIPLPDRIKVRVLLGKRGVNPGIRSWITSVHRWRAGVMDLAAKHHADDIVVAPDGNVDAHKVWVQKMLHRAWAGLELAYTKGGDLGGRAIGWVMTSMRFEGGRVFKAASSDHKAGRYKLSHINPPKVDPPPASPPPPFEVITYNAVRMDQKTKCAVQTLEAGSLKDLAPLTLYQGGYNPGGVSASAGTHDLGGVLDFSPFEHVRKVHAWRADIGGPMWHRPAIPGLWGEHCHAVMNNEGNLAPAAARQVTAYFAGLDGLADGARDPNQFHPHVGFSYEVSWHKLHG
jgi:hypothetical protein